MLIIKCIKSMYPIYSIDLTRQPQHVYQEQKVKLYFLLSLTKTLPHQLELMKELSVTLFWFQDTCFVMSLHMR
jgi:hypothetical protein